MCNSKILVVMTGGTICSFTDENGKRYSNAGEVKIIEKFKQGNSEFSGIVEFDKIMPIDILSENMTIGSWNILLDTFRSTVETKKYEGIIILHGTDTLAYTASLLSVVLVGIKIPVCLVSSQLPLEHSGTNGHINFRAAVELIMNKIEPNVYAVYQNSDGEIYVHYGSHLLQCENYSQDFFSVDAMRVNNPDNACIKGKRFETDNPLIYRMGSLTPCVLRIVPFVGINYNSYNLSGVCAVVHGTYHSDTVCVERKNGMGDYSVYSVLHLADRCKEKNIPLFLAPCSSEAYKYESTGDILEKGAYDLCSMTNEMAYVKTLVGCALGLKDIELKNFINKSVNYEVIYK